MKYESMMHVTAALLAVCFGMQSARAQAEPCSLVIATQLDLQPDTGLFPARINGVQAFLKLDTGAFSTILTPDAAKRLGLREDLDRSLSFRGQPEQTYASYGVGGQRVLHKLVARTFDLGNRLHGRQFHVLVGDIKLKQADGLLSTDFLQDYDLDLDFAGGQIRLFQTAGSCPHPKVLLAPAVFSIPLIRDEEDPRPRVHVAIDGITLNAIVDTGAHDTVLFRHSAVRLGLQDAALARDPRLQVNGIGPGMVTAARHTVGTLTVGDLTLKNARILVVNDRPVDDTDMLLGADFQHKMHLWISNSAHALVIEYPPKASPAVP